MKTKSRNTAIKSNWIINDGAAGNDGEESQWRSQSILNEGTNKLINTILCRYILKINSK
jgi:hypothetical protein